MPQRFEDYNKIYAEHEVALSEGKPDPIVQNVLKYRTSARVRRNGTGHI
jgi:hypothetical protein